MAHYAKVENSLVTQVIVAEAEFFDTFVDSSPGTWLQTSYNTHGGIHTLGGTPLRKNYAGVGFTYDATKDAFIPPQPYPTWFLDENHDWQPPKPKPEPDYGMGYVWDEGTLEWFHLGNI